MPPKAEEEEVVEAGSVPIPPSLAWTDITLADVQAYMALETPKECLEFVANKMGLQDYDTNARSAVITDLYLWLLEFAKKNGLSEEKTSACFTILKKTHEFAVGGRKSLEDVFEFCKKLVLLHSLQGVEGGVQLLSPSDVEIFTDYVTTSYMRHYRLYQYVQYHDQSLDQFTARLFVNTVMPPPPLKDARMEVPEGQTKGAPQATDDSVGRTASDPVPGEEAPRSESPTKEPSEDKDAAVQEKIRELLEAKTKLMHEAFEQQLQIRTATLNAKLKGLGV